jgi:hypothetical protein
MKTAEINEMISKGASKNEIINLAVLKKGIQHYYTYENKHDYSANKWIKRLLERIDICWSKQIQH